MNINWDEITEEEADLLLAQLNLKFYIMAKCYDVNELQEVSYLQIDGRI